MLEKPFFSIIVPVYKVEKYLPQCADSLLAQDFDNFEIIVVDDGSPDGCPKICDEYASKYTKVKVIHKSNGGLSDARNAGVAVAQGKYITFVDSDDFWRSNDVLSGVHKVIESNNAPDIVVSDFIKYYDQTDKYLEPAQTCPVEMNGKSKQEILEYLYFYHADMKMSACQKFVRRQLLISSPFQKGLLSEDIDWSLKIYPQAKSIAVYPKPFYCYRQGRVGSITNTASKRSFDSLMYILDKWEPELKKINIPEEEKEIYLGYLCYQLSISMLIYCNLKKEEKNEALKLIINHKGLFSYRLNRKTKSVSRLINILGIKKTCLALKSYLRFRQLLKLG